MYFLCPSFFLNKIMTLEGLLKGIKCISSSEMGKSVLSVSYHHSRTSWLARISKETRKVNDIKYTHERIRDSIRLRCSKDLSMAMLMSQPGWRIRLRQNSHLTSRLQSQTLSKFLMHWTITLNKRLNLLIPVSLVRIDTSSIYSF